MPRFSWRPPRLHSVCDRALPALAWLGAAGLAAGVLADAFWRWQAPAPRPAPRAPVGDLAASAQAITARHLFGQTGESGAGTAAAPATPFRLLGLMASGGHGFALIAEEGQAPRPVLEGEEIAAGVSLHRIRPDRVEIRRQGHSEELPLAEPGLAASPAPQPGSPLSPASGRASTPAARS